MEEQKEYDKNGKGSFDKIRISQNSSGNDTKFK